MSDFSCCICVVDPERKATQWNTAVTLFEGSAFCHEHFILKLQNKAVEIEKWDKWFKYPDEVEGEPLDGK